MPSRKVKLLNYLNWDMELNKKDSIYETQKDKYARSIYAGLNSNSNLNNALTKTLEKIRKFTDIEAAAIRLEEKGDYIYYVHDGFPKSFLKKENSIVAIDKNGGWLLSPDKKNYLLECMCGHIIRGKADSSLSFFTQGGSFWSNSTTELFATTTEREHQAITRNYCNYCGYESVALMPVRANEVRLGLLQLNDHRKDMFSLDLIEFMEKIAIQIGFAVQSNLEFIKLKEAADKIKLLNIKLKIVADKDPLTGLPNRRSFMKILKLERNRANRINKPFTLLMADIDHFKKINDLYGHNAGDKVLIKVSKELVKSIRKSDIVSRWGGDEFLMLLPETNQQGGVDLANKLINLFRKKMFRHLGNKINLAISIGVFECLENKNLNECLKIVDNFLIKAKGTGRDRIVAI
jgi:diguanylate cyclase (GGDEF)-like protein